MNIEISVYLKAVLNILLILNICLSFISTPSQNIMEAQEA